MPGSCRIRFPVVPSIQNAEGGVRRMYESCRGGSCSRSGSPQKCRPPLWEPKPCPPCSSRNRSPTPGACPARPQTAPTISVSATFHPPAHFDPPPQLPERPTSARSARSDDGSQRSYESCQYSNCSRSPCLTPRVFDESIYPYEKPRSLSPPGWPYSSKRRTRRGKWWDKDWPIAERTIHYQNPELQPCGCHKSRVHSGSRTPSPRRSPRAIGLEYHYNRLANSAERGKFSRTPTPKRERFSNKGVNSDDDKLEGFGHCHQYEKWSCSSSPPRPSRSRSESPTFSGRSITPSPTRSSSPAATRTYTPAKQRPPTPRLTPRQQTPARQRPQTPRQQGGGGGEEVAPFVNSHGHSHTYNAWSCTPSKRNTPKDRSRSPTPPPPPRSDNGAGTATINISYSPHSPLTVEQSTTTEDYTHDLKGLRPAGGGQQQPSTTLEANSLASGHQVLSHCHCHHFCPTCGHHGHHGPTLFSLTPPSPAFSSAACSCGCCHEAQICQHHHHCHCFHHHHH